MKRKTVCRRNHSGIFLVVLLIANQSFLLAQPSKQDSPKAEIEDDYEYDDSLDEFDILYDLGKGNNKPKLGMHFKHGPYEALMHGRKEEDYIDEAREMEENRVPDDPDMYYDELDGEDDDDPFGFYDSSAEISDSAEEARIARMNVEL